MMLARDYASFYTARSTLVMLVANTVQQLRWPAKSLDLNEMQGSLTVAASVLLGSQSILLGSPSVLLGSPSVLLGSPSVLLGSPSVLFIRFVLLFHNSIFIDTFYQ